MLKKAAALFLVCAGIAMGVGCVSNSTTSTNGKYLYAAIPSTSQIVAYREDPNSGSLTQVAGSPITAGPSVEALAFHPSRQYLYAANTNENDVSLFLVSSTTGALLEITPRTEVGIGPTLLAMDPGGKYLYVGNSGSFDISAFSIDANSGKLTAVGPSVPIGMTPLNMALSPSGNVLYVTGQSLGGYVLGLPLANGTIDTSKNVMGPYLASDDPFGLAIDPAGKYLYTGNKIDSSISEFAINSDGSLTQLPNSPVGEAYSAPISLLIEPTGKYLYATNQGSANVGGYSIGSTGAINLLATSPFKSQTQPSVITTDHAGKFVFVGSQASPPTLQPFNLDLSTGTLTLITTYHLTGIPTSIVLTP